MSIFDKFEFRSIKSDEAGQAAKIEQICFPPNEACSEERIRERVAEAPELFWWQLINRQEGLPDF